MHHEKATDKTLLHDMVRKSNQRLIHMSTGHRLRDALDIDMLSEFRTKHHPVATSPVKLARQLTALPDRGSKYAVAHAAETHDVQLLLPNKRSVSPIKLKPHHIKLSGSLSEHDAILNDQPIPGTGGPTDTLSPLAHITNYPTELDASRVLYKNSITSVHVLNTLGKLTKARKKTKKGPVVAQGTSKDEARLWFRDLKRSATEPIALPMPPPGAFRHHKWLHLTYGSSVYLESSITRTCLLLDSSGKSVPNTTARDAPDPGTLFRIVDFTNPMRRGFVYEGDEFWLRLDHHRPHLVKDRDPVALYVNDVQHLLSWSIAADGGTKSTKCVASVLETLVPSIAHYGYDTSMVECLRENHAAMQLAKWVVGVKGAVADDDPLGDDFEHKKAMLPSDPVCNYATVYLRQGDMVLRVDSPSRRGVLAVLQNLRGAE
ncbi:Aste57867_10119 [Aphanomyces stellatus]|uniref:Aste57867_10119 protein n=1 Tax=Aphanomyces stellatus TaxID=120398 RepID=A0A485KPJ6_9STRA|nr:hypothetical protein As57867_010080 [Aphanomyces stellatus]VFT86995.1 Aste57867_10119 [Aphanomyces stellatus]